MTDAEQFEQFIMSPSLDEFVQVNADKYRAKWRAMFAKAGTIKKTAARWSWNWPAFFLGGVWMLYRKMYAPGIFWLAVVAVLVLYPTLPGDLPGQDAMGSLPLILFLVAGMFGNGWYFQHVYKCVSAPSGMTNPKGVSWPSALTGAVLYLGGISACLFYAPSLLADRSTQSAEEVVNPASEEAAAPQPSRPDASNAAAGGDVAALAGTYNYQEECCGGAVEITSGPNALHVHINTATKEDAHLCDVEADAAQSRMTGNRSGTIDLEATDAKCSVHLSINGDGLTVSSTGDECSQLCGSGAGFDGAYRKGGQ